MSTTPGCRQNFAEECEAAINKQINVELFASYVYMAMAWHFDRDDVALPGFHKFFKHSSDEERGHAEALMTYQNQRGGRVVLQDVGRPTASSWTSGLEAMRQALELEKTVNSALLQLHAIADRAGDPHLQDFLEGTFLQEQVESIKQLSDYVSQLSHCGAGLGEFMFDKEVLQH